MGHAGAIVSGGSGTAQEKMARFLDAGIPVAKTPSEIPGLIAAALKPRKTKLTLLRSKGKAKAKPKSKPRSKSKSKPKPKSRPKGKRSRG
jgi:hypothetical protein